MTYGADISRKEYIRVTLAAGIGSVLEWYDYSILTGMSPVLQQAFFPSSSLAAKQLSFWSVYAVGYLFRPLGSLLFGSICDVHGRRVSLMATFMMMAVPTVLIGCLPTYSQAGIAAPVLLSLLRLVQGIAVGGELGTAVVFMHELAPAGRKTLGGSIIFLGVTAGILMGIIVSMIVTAAIPQDALLHWGWRIPFLIAVLTAGAGLLLRYKMPESYEFEQDEVKAAHKKRMQQLLLERRSSGSSSFKRHASQQQQQQHTQSAVEMQRPGAGNSATDLACELDSSISQADPKPLVQQQEQPAQLQPQPQPLPVALHQQQEQQQLCEGLCLRWFGHGPIKLLLKHHWREVLLLFWFETWSAANFYAFYGWLPSHIATQWRVQSELTLGMTLVNMTLTLGIIPAAAHLADKGLPRLAATAAVLAVAAVASVPMLLAIRTRSMVAAWLMQMLDLFLNASIFGWLPTIGSRLFPVSVRATGYNFAHTAAQSWLGGLTPVIISAIALRLQQDAALPGAIYVVTGVYLTACAAISLVALAIMWRKFPQTNRDSAVVLPE